MKNARILGALTLAAACMSSQAAIVTFSSLASWQAAAGASTATQDFNGFAADTATDSGAVILGGGMSVSSVTSTVLPWTIDAPPLDNDFECNVDSTARLCGFSGNQLTFSFAGGISAFGADFSSLNDDLVRTQFELFDGTTLIATLTPALVAGQTDQFFGFVATGGETITSWRTKFIAADTFGIDNIAIVGGGTVPEPMSLALVASALLGLSVSRRARRSRG